ncbi:NIPSNAP family protein [Methylobacterium sp. J-076]|uniref:NIPSNAP family protein n=1 Tax=Methylobacterium sp. J-076 TaxID=2836655 RepID=UPI001FBA4B39|nr:NIPSNAP family protein [Methylobacterium sp. J-076]MCJ2014876.1 NIPSNAP family protein [Methylobacterium sp. J-076]
MLYELASLSCHLLAVGKVAQGAAAWAEDPAAGGTLLGCWRTEIGPLGRVIVLRGYSQPEDMTVERRRALMSEDPFRGGGAITALEMDSYAPFPFLPEARLDGRGGIFEFRTYRLKPGGLPPTLAAWEAAMEPAREYTQHLVVNLYALDGPPRITHIWAFDSLEQRARLREAHYANGTWPPKGGPDQIAEAVSVIALPMAGPAKG